MENYGILLISSLVPFKNHPFKLYESKRLDDMVESIKEKGIIVPIIVRPVASEENKYEILSGHNRFEAAKIIELNEIPAVIYENLTDFEAMLIVTESNLIQRSFSELTDIEKAEVIGVHHFAAKQSGRNEELVQELEKLLSPVATEQGSTRDMGRAYGLSKDTVARYLRIYNYLIPELKARLDKKRIEMGTVGDKLSLRTAVSLSYLREKEQKIIDGLLKGLLYHIDMKKAENLKEESKNHELMQKDIKRLLSSQPEEERKRVIKINESIYGKYFKEDDSTDEIEKVIAEALQKWFEERGNITDI